MAILSLGVGAVSGISGLLGGGPDAKKYAERTARISGAYAEAKNGNIQGFWVLGATGQVAPMPQTITFLGTTFNAGYTSRDWGSAYNPIVDKAARYYRELAPKYQNAASATTAQLGGATIPGVTPVITAAVEKVPGWMWWLVGGAVAFILFRSLKGR